MIKEVVLEKAGEQAIVKVTDENKVEVDRGGAVTVFRPQYTVDKVLDEFRSNGWKEQEPGYVADGQAVIDNLEKYQEAQNKIDAYIELHTKKAELEREMKKLREEVRGYMNETGKQEMKGTKGTIVLQPAKASNSTSTYTDYLLNDVMSELPNQHLKKVTEIRINATKLEGLLKSGAIDEGTVKRIKSLKVVKEGTPRFTVKK